MKITNLKVTSKFRYLWLKTVTNVRLSQHCASCLVGEYNPNINPQTTQLDDLVLPDCVHYLCGVSTPYNWHKNFHLAFMPSKGNSVHYENNGIIIDIEDAVALPISEKSINPQHPKVNVKSYCTCRNWQFAHWFNDNLKSSEPILHADCDDSYSDIQD